MSTEFRTRCDLCGQASDGKRPHRWKTIRVMPTGHNDPDWDREYDICWLCINDSDGLVKLVRLASDGRRV